MWQMICIKERKRKEKNTTHIPLVFFCWNRIPVSVARLKIFINLNKHKTVSFDYYYFLFFSKCLTERLQLCNGRWCHVSNGNAMKITRNETNVGAIFPLSSVVLCVFLRPCLNGRIVEAITRLPPPESHDSPVRRAGFRPCGAQTRHRPSPLTQESLLFCACIYINGCFCMPIPLPYPFLRYSTLIIPHTAFFIFYF